MKLSQELYLATLRGEKSKVVELIKNGAEINKIGDTGQFPIHAAVDDGNIDIIKILIENGADLDVLTKPGYSASHIAVLRNQSEALKLLLENGANQNIRDPHGNTLLWTAVMHYRGDDSIINFLLSRGLDPSIPNNHGNSLLKILDMPKNEKIRPLFKEYGYSYPYVK